MGRGRNGVVSGLGGGRQEVEQGGRVDPGGTDMCQDPLSIQLPYAPQFRADPRRLIGGSRGLPSFLKETSQLPLLQDLCSTSMHLCMHVNAA